MKAFSFQFTPRAYWWRRYRVSVQIASRTKAGLAVHLEMSAPKTKQFPLQITEVLMSAEETRQLIDALGKALEEVEAAR